MQHWLGNEGMPRPYVDCLPTDGFTVLNSISSIGVWTTRGGSGNSLEWRSAVRGGRRRVARPAPRATADVRLERDLAASLRPVAPGRLAAGLLAGCLLICLTGLVAGPVVVAVLAPGLVLVTIGTVLFSDRRRRIEASPGD